MATEYARGQGTGFTSIHFDFFAITHKGRCIVPNEDRSSGRMEVVFNEPGNIDYARYVAEVECLDVVGAHAQIRGRIVERGPTGQPGLEPIPPEASWMFFVVYDGEDAQQPDGFNMGYETEAFPCVAANATGAPPISDGDIRVRDDIAG